MMGGFRVSREKRTRRTSTNHHEHENENDITLQPLDYANTPLRRHTDTFPTILGGWNTNCAAQFIVLHSP